LPATDLNSQVPIDTAASNMQSNSNEVDTSRIKR
jgi:hypothetical protein